MGLQSIGKVFLVEAPWLMNAAGGAINWAKMLHAVFLCTDRM